MNIPLYKGRNSLMYHITVPMMNLYIPRAGREALLREVQRLDAHRVLLVIQPYLPTGEKRDREFALLRENIAFFKENGLEVGIWMWAFAIMEENNYVGIETLDGQKLIHDICPLNEDFCAYAADYLTQLPAMHPHIILFDDDFRLGMYGKEPGCLCELHRARIAEQVGELPERDELARRILFGGPNRYRTAWLDANRDSLLSFCRMAREAVDRVDPTIRMGVCSCMSAWDADGRAAEEIDRTLAGRNRPIRRLIGAPYWAPLGAWRNRLPNIFELNRMEVSWFSNPETELFCEGDTFPRPRSSCPARYLELYDMAMRADGTTDGILKYGLDYYATAAYETGYAARHEKNVPIYREIQTHFADKTAVGVRVYAYPHKIEQAVLTEDGVMDCMFFSTAARMLSDCSIPTTYYGDGICGIVFGEDARQLPLHALDHGMILDAHAAQILSARGVDVGAVWGEKTFSASFERFRHPEEVVSVSVTSTCCTVADGATVLSDFHTDGECPGAGTPAAYLYENASGQRFLVFTFEIGFSCEERLYRSYARSCQIANAVEWLCGKKLPAYIRCQPDVYVMAKTDGSSMAIGLWNCYADEVINPVIELGMCAGHVHAINCTARLDGDRVYLSDIEPFAFAGVVVQ